MARTDRTMTRRQLLRSAGVGAAGLALTGTVGELVCRRARLLAEQLRRPRAPTLAQAPRSADPGADGHPQRAGRLARPDLHRPVQRPARRRQAR